MYPNCTNLSYNEIFARNVKARREALGLTRKELAEAHMGYPEELLARVESGDATGITIDFLVCLAEYLKTPIEILMTSRYFCPHYEKTTINHGKVIGFACSTSRSRKENIMKVKVRIKNQASTPVKVAARLPTVHVVHVHTNWPVAPAHWRPMLAYPAEFICSECGELWPDEKTRFCPHCGARMR